MAKTTEEKIAELSVLVNDLKQKFPLIEHSVSEISNTLTREQMNIGMLTKQYDKLYEVTEEFKKLQYTIQKLSDDSKKFTEQMDVVKTKVEEVITKERNCDFIHALQQSQENIKNTPPKTVWNLEKILSIFPNVLVMLSAVGYVIYLILMDRMEKGGF